MTTVADCVELTKRQLYGSHRSQYNFLQSAISDTATTVQFHDNLQGIIAGAVLAVDSEMLYVRTATPGTKTATVARGWLGTEAASHPTTSPVEVSPRFPQPEIKRALKDEIASWGSSVFRVAALDTSISGSTRAIDLSDLEQGWYRIIGVWRSTTRGDHSWPKVKYRVIPSTAEFPSGCVVLNDWGTSASITILAGVQFDLTQWDDDTDLETDCGLSPSMMDIPPIGAAWRLLAPREIGRLEMGTQGEPRSAQEVQGGMISSVARGLKLVRDTRLADEAHRLQNMYPWSM